MAGRTRLAAHHSVEQELNNEAVYSIPTANLNVRDRRIPFSMLTPSPTPSPEELIIKSRGRKMTPESWSPICQEKTCPQLNTTPIKMNYRNNVPVRCSPRKRLNLSESFPNSDSTANSTKGRKVTTPIKRRRVKWNLFNICKAPLAYQLKALSKEQLAGIILTVGENHPELQKELDDLVPDPDLKPLEEQLNKLRTNVFRALPSSRLSCKTDSLAYQRVAVHLQTFKGKELVESQSWNSVLEYVFIAWDYVRSTPIWDNPPHNKIRDQCFRALTSFAMKALKKLDITSPDCSDLITRFESCDLFTSVAFVNMVDSVN